MNHTPTPWPMPVKSMDGERALIDTSDGLIEVYGRNRHETAAFISRASNAHDKLVEALRAVEAHHVEQNSLKGRPEERSKTLQIVRAALAKVEGK